MIVVVCIGLCILWSLLPQHHILKMNTPKPNNFRELERAEANLLSFMRSQYTTKSVNVGGSVDLHTIIVNSTGKGTPIVLVHGFGLPSAGWVVILDKLAEQRPVYCFDLPGWGLSFRGDVQGDAETLESYYVEAVEAWRKSMELERFVLVGFSLGGFVATSYTMRYQERVQHLVLLDPWGLAEKPAEIQSIFGMQNRLVIFFILKFASSFNAFSLQRNLPCLGRWLNRIAGKEVLEGYRHYPCYNSLSDAAAEYVYQSLLLTPMGEDIFRRLNEGLVYAKNPLLPRMQQFKVPTLVIRAEMSYIVQASEEEFRTHLAPGTKFEMVMINGSKHNDVDLDPQTPIIINAKVSEIEAYQENLIDL